MEVSLAVRIGYVSALDGNISAEVFDAFALPENTPYPYVLISSQTEVQREVTDGKVYDVTVQIDVVTGSQEPIGRQQAEEIASEIENIINPDTYQDIDIATYGYRIADTNRELGFSQFDRNGIFYINRKIIIYRHLCHKF